jgi:hypothetical protein
MVRRSEKAIKTKKLYWEKSQLIFLRIIKQTNRKYEILVATYISIHIAKSSSVKNNWEMATLGFSMSFSTKW